MKNTSFLCLEIGDTKGKLQRSAGVSLPVTHSHNNENLCISGTFRMSIMLACTLPARFAYKMDILETHSQTLPEIIFLCLPAKSIWKRSISLFTLPKCPQGEIHLLRQLHGKEKVFASLLDSNLLQVCLRRKHWEGKGIHSFKA